MTKVLFFLQEFLLGQGPSRKITAHSKIFNWRVFSEGNIENVWAGVRESKGVQKHRETNDSVESSPPWGLRGKHRAVYQSLERTVAGNLWREEPPKEACVQGEPGNQYPKLSAPIPCSPEGTSHQADPSGSQRKRELGCHGLLDSCAGASEKQGQWVWWR